MVREAMDRGYRVLLVTFTFSHHYGDRLADLRAAFSEALEKMRNTRGWVQLRSRYGVLGFVRGHEVTHGANGWHPHCHELWVCDAGADVEQLARDVRAAYLAALAKVGLTASAGVGVDVRAADEDISRYIAKFGRPPRWDAAKEVSNGRRKAGRGKGVTPWQLLAQAADGDTTARGLFLEYAQAYRGVRQLYVSRGLVDALNLGSSFADVEALDAPDVEDVGATVVVSLTQVELNCLFALHLEADLLAYALTHSPGECRAYVDAAHRRVLPEDFGGAAA